MNFCFLSIRKSYIFAKINTGRQKGMNLPPTFFLNISRRRKIDPPYTHPAKDRPRTSKASFFSGAPV